MDSTHVPDGKLTRVYSPSTKSGDNLVDIIAIHGLGTTSPHTWQATIPSGDGGASRRVNWLSDNDMLPAIIPNSNIYTFSWKSNYYESGPVTRIEDVADVLLDEIKHLRREESNDANPLIFIASCFGGLILTKAFEKANVHGSVHRPSLLSTAGVVFLGSPLQGSEAASAAQWQTMLGGILGKSPSKTLLQDLDGHTKALRDTSRRFVELIRKPPMQMETMCFWETLPTQILNAVLPRSLTRFSPLPKTLLVSQDSACLLGFPEMSLDAPHSMMNKFRGPEDPNFQKVSRVLGDMAQQAHSIVEAQRQVLATSIFSVPFSRDSKFIDRKEIFDDIDEHLQNHRRASISGIGGVGKSQIAIEYAYRFHDDHPDTHVFWIYAATTTSFTKAYREIADKMKFPGYDKPGVDQLRLVARWLEKENSRWLMILDNVDDAKLFFPSTDFDDASSLVEEPAELLSDYLPSKLALQQSLIVTTRSTIIGSDFALGEPCINVGHFSTAQARLLLQSKLESHNVAFDLESCGELLEILGCVPLAVTQAAAFMKRNRIPLKEYYSFLAKDDSNLMEFLSEELQDGRRPKGKPNSVFRTWKLSFDSIVAESPNSAHLLSLMSMFDHQSIPEMLLRGQFQKDVDFLGAAGDLAGYSLITKEDGTKTFAIHPLVRASVRYWLQYRNEEIKYMRMSLQILADNFPNTRYENKAICEMLLVHTQLVLHYPCVEEDLETRCILLCTVGWFRYQQGKYTSADRLLSESYENSLKLWGETASLTLDTLQNLAAVKHSQGNFPLAEAMYRRMEACELPVQYEVDCLKGLGWAILCQEQHEKAETIFRKGLKVIEDNERFSVNIGKKREGLLHGLAETFTRQKHYKEAEQIYREVVQSRKAVLGIDHPRTLASLQGLAEVLTDQNQYREAEQIYREVVKSRKAVLGTDHLETLITRQALADVLADQKQYKEAEQIFQEVVGSGKAVLGTDHPETITTEHNLAWNYYEQGRYDDAFPLMKDVVEKSKRVLGTKHPDTLLSIHMLAKIESEGQQSTDYERDQGPEGKRQRKRQKVT